MKRKGILIAGVVFVLALVLALIRPASLPADADAKSDAKSSGGFSFSMAAGVRKVDVTSPRRGSIKATIEAPGAVRAGSEVGVGARFEGRVAELVRDTGDPVEGGQVLFRLDPTDKQELVTDALINLKRNRGALAEAEAELSEARRLFDDARREPSDVTEARLRLKQAELTTERTIAQRESADTRLTRARTMQREGIGRATEVETASDEYRVATISARISEEELLLARETLVFRVRTWEESRATSAKTVTISQVRRDNARSDVEASELRLVQAQRDVTRCEILSPLTGVVTARGVNSGDLVSRMTADVSHYIVSDLEHLLVYADVDEGDVVRVERGQPALVRVNALGDDRLLKAAVYDVGYRAQESNETSTFQVRVLLEAGQDGHAQLRPGMSANVTITVAQNKDALKVPLQAVVQREVQELPEAMQSDPSLAGLEPLDLVDVVYAAVAGEAKVRLVELGIQDEDEAEVVSGVGPEDQLIVGPFRALEALRDGKAIEPVEAEDVLPPDSDAEVAPVNSATD